MSEPLIYSDTEMLNWIGEHEANLVSHHEKLGDGYGIWWNVVKRKRSLSGHPLGTPRRAIEAAMNRKKSIKKTVPGVTE